MRCSSCAAFVDDDATTCTSCGAEVSGAPPPLPPELADAPPGEESADDGGGDGGGVGSGYAGYGGPEPGSSPSLDAGASKSCDGCHGSFPVMELERVHSQRLCASCASKVEEPARPSSGRMPTPSTGQAKPVSRAPLAIMGAAVVVLAGVAIYFTVLNPGKTSPAPAPAPTAAPSPGPGTEPPPAPLPAVPIPAPVLRPEDITFEGVLQQWEPEGIRKNPKWLAFVNAAGRELRLTGADKHLANDLTVGKAYRVTFRAVPSEDKIVESKYKLASTKIEPVE